MIKGGGMGYADKRKVHPSAARCSVAIGTSFAGILENYALAYIDNQFNLHYNKHYCESLFTYVNNNMNNGRVFQNAVLIN